MRNQLGFFFMLTIALACAACGSGSNAAPANTPGANLPVANSADNPAVQPEARDAYKATLDAYLAGLQKMDIDAMLATLTPQGQRKPDRLKKDIAELRESVERIEIFNRSEFYDEMYRRWECHYDMTLFMKNGKEDGEPNKQVWLVLQRGKWRVDTSGLEESDRE